MKASMTRNGREFRTVDTGAVAHAVMAPMIFLMLHKHSFGACPIQGCDVDPKATLRAHADLMLHGLMRDRSGTHR